MKRFVRSGVLVLLSALAQTPVASKAFEMVSDEGLRALDMQRMWSITVPLGAGESILRSRVLDDNLYLFSTANRVFAVHIYTGILRWSNEIGKAGQPIRGPSHNQNYTFFTTPGSVRVIDRRTGEPAAEPRPLRGVIVEVKHDIAEINMGEVHGLKGGEILNVHTINEVGEAEGSAFATLTITTVQQRSAKGKLTRLNSSVIPQAGHHVSADLMLPLREVILPFAASSAAAADEASVYVGAANQKFYCLDIIRGVQRWSILTPRTVVAQPFISGQNLYIAGQDGLIISCTKNEKVKRWTYPTEGPIFADLLVTAEKVYAASSDRSLYCLDAASGKKLWRERFDTGLMNPPVFSDNRIYQLVPDGGLFVLDANNGAQLWKRPQGGSFLIQVNQDAYLAESNSPVLLRLNAKDGASKQEVPASTTVAVSASQDAGAIFLADKDGGITCIRSRFAPRLKPEDLTAVLRDDRKIRMAEELDRQTQLAKVVKKKEEPRRVSSRDLLFEQDWLTSTSSIRPVGGHDMAEPEAKTDGAAAVKEGDSEAGDSEEKEATDSEEADSADEEKSDDAKEPDDDESEDEGDEDSADADDESSDDEDSNEDEDGEEEDEESEDEDSEDEEEEDDDKGGG